MAISGSKLFTWYSSWKRQSVCALMHGAPPRFSSVYVGTPGRMFSRPVEPVECFPPAMARRERSTKPSCSKSSRISPGWEIDGELGYYIVCTSQITGIVACPRLRQWPGFMQPRTRLFVQQCSLSFVDYTHVKEVDELRRHVADWGQFHGEDILCHCG